ncbi:MAG: amino acid ABC transporter permease [Hyphomicrobiales bacterium]|nr:amino acid ABC transporter permease [Hyphomicrobiales bacterium]
MADSSTTLNRSSGPPKTKVAPWNDPKVRGFFFQVVLLVALLWFCWWLFANTTANLERQKIASGFDFLGTTAGFGIIQTPIDYSETSTYGRAFMVGLINTLIVSVIGCVVATVLGFLIGVARLSHNWLVSRLAAVYIEIFRNIPLLLQIFFWYFVVLRLLPHPRDSLRPFSDVYINVRGIFTPNPVPLDGFSVVVIAFVVAVVAIVFLRRWATRRQESTGQTFPVFWTSVGLLVLLPLIGAAVTGFPMTWEYPKATRFSISGGFTIYPELAAMVMALSVYTASFIAEIVRAGILAVSHGQTEAAHSLGLRNGPTLRLVIIPQAMRVIIPPLTSQYLNLTKNSSLSAAIAYPELVSVFAGTVLNQTGQAIEVIGITMLVYATISLSISAGMNIYNKKMALVER